MQKMILIPSTFTSDEKNLIIRKYKIGLIARACATFGITDIGIYYDPDPKFDSHGLGRFIVKVLKYINTPPYLRKIAFEKDNSLRYIGVIEPLKTPHHLDKIYGSRYRYAYVISLDKKYLHVTDGSKKYRVKINPSYKSGEKIIVIDTKKKKIIDKRTLPFYFGFDAFYYNKGLVTLLNQLQKREFCIIGTSRYGDPVNRVKIKCGEKIAIVFGSPYRGLREMLGNGYRDFFNYFINVVPDQKVETIRTEEAVFYTLSILHVKSVI